MLKKKLKPHIGKKSIILIVVFALLIAVDLLTKFFEEKYGWHARIIPGFLEIEGRTRNPGCAFGFLNRNPQIGQPILITLTFIMLAVLVTVFVLLPERFTLSKTTIAVVCSGAVGNLVDRLAFNEVRDWFGINMFGNMTYCNFADFCIVVGVILAVIDLLFLNEFSVFPLTKKAKAAQAERKAREDEDEHKKNLQSENSDTESKPVNDANDVGENKE